jgi:IS4 transposase
VVQGLEYLAKDPARTLNERLAPFEDVLIRDSTIVRLHEKLAKIWPATRSRKVAAGLKIGVIMSAITNGPKSVSLYAESTNDLKTLRIGPWIKDRILLVDLGFYKYQIFSRIQENGGYFVSRLKSNSNPLILEVNRTYRGRSIDVCGSYLQEVLKNLKRQVLDAEVEVAFKRRSYRGKERNDTERFRLVAVFNEDEGKYHMVPGGRWRFFSRSLRANSRWMWFLLPIPKSSRPLFGSLYSLCSLAEEFIQLFED